MNGPCQSAPLNKLPASFFPNLTCFIIKFLVRKFLFQIEKAPGKVLYFMQSLTSSLTTQAKTEDKKEPQSYGCMTACQIVLELEKGCDSVDETTTLCGADQHKQNKKWSNDKVKRKFRKTAIKINLRSRNICCL